MMDAYNYATAVMVVVMVVVMVAGGVISALLYGCMKEGELVQIH